MRTNLSMFSFCLMIVFQLNNTPAMENNSNADDEYKVLFIGSSYFEYFDVQTKFEQLAAHSGKSVFVDESVIPGLYLADHVTLVRTDTKIKSQQWDFVILQGVGVLMAYPNEVTHHAVYPALVSLKEKILNNCPTTKIIFCLPWAYEDGMTWYHNWPDTYDMMQDKITDRTIQYSNEIGFTIAPVGYAWQTALQELEYPVHYLFLSDWNHASLEGTYLMACVIYSTVYLESTENIDYYAGISESEAKYFQSVATRTVFDNSALWNIAATGIEKNNVPSDIELYQNFPNPFNPTTTIIYSIEESSNVQLNIYSLSGELVTCLEDDFKNAGKYSLVFNAGNISSGVYIFQLRSDNSTINRKMVFLK